MYPTSEATVLEWLKSMDENDIKEFTRKLTKLEEIAIKSYKMLKKQELETKRKSLVEIKKTLRKTRSK